MLYIIDSFETFKKPLDCDQLEKIEVAEILTQMNQIAALKGAFFERTSQVFMGRRDLLQGQSKSTFLAYRKIRPSEKPIVDQKVREMLKRYCCFAKMSVKKQYKCYEKIESLKTAEGESAIKMLIKVRDILIACNGGTASILTLQDEVAFEASRIKRMIPEITIGSSIILSKNYGRSPVIMAIKKRIGSLDGWTKVATVFRGYLLDKERPVGKCKLRIEKGFSECADQTYRGNRVIDILRLDSFGRNMYRFIGTALMEAAMEYGMTRGTDRRINLYSAPDALGFYYKLGMRSGDENFDRHIVNGGEPLDSYEAVPLYLPASGIPQWKSKIVRPVLFASRHDTST